MKGLAAGIDKSKKYVEKAVGGVAKAMQLTMDSDLNYSLHGISGAMLPDWWNDEQLLQYRMRWIYIESYQAVILKAIIGKWLWFRR